MEDINVTKACGCCLSADNLSPVSEEAIKFFAFCFSIQISNFFSSNNSSPFICNLCNRKIKDCYEFRCQILDSQTKLKDLHSSSNLRNGIKIEFDNENFTFANLIKEELLSDSNDAELPSSSLKFNKIDPISIVDVKFGKEGKEVVTKHKVKSSSKSKAVKKIKSLQKNQTNPECESPPFKLSKEDTVCNLCGEKFTHNKLLVSHMGVHFPNFVCNVCGKPFVVKKNFLRHVKVHEGENASCTVCKKTLKASYLTVHMKNHSEKKNRFSCPQCSERFVSYHHRVKHMEKVHKRDVYIHHCKICPKKFHMAHMLSQHVRRNHFRELNVICSVCGKGFFGSKDLSDHMVKHTGEKKYQCDICSKSYTKKWSLVLHLRAHSGNVRKHKCILCNKEFTQNGSLTVHMKNVHKK